MCPYHLPVSGRHSCLLDDTYSVSRQSKLSFRCVFRSVVAFFSFWCSVCPCGWLIYCCRAFFFSFLSLPRRITSWSYLLFWCLDSNLYCFYFYFFLDPFVNVLFVFNLVFQFQFVMYYFFNWVFQFQFSFQEEEGSGWNINRAQWRATPLAHRQPLLFLFPFSFSFPFVFSFVFCILYCSREMWTLESSSPPASASHCSSSSSSPSHSASYFAFTIVRRRRPETEQNRAQWTAVPSAHHRPPPFPLPVTPLSLPLLLLLLLLLHLHLLYAPLFTWTVESFSTIHGRTESGPNLNARCLGPTQ